MNTLPANHSDFKRTGDFALQWSFSRVTGAWRATAGKTTTKWLSNCVSMMIFYFRNSSSINRQQETFQEIQSHSQTATIFLWGEREEPRQSTAKLLSNCVYLTIFGFWYPVIPRRQIESRCFTREFQFLVSAPECRPPGSFSSCPAASRRPLSLPLGSKLFPGEEVYC